MSASPTDPARLSGNYRLPLLLALTAAGLAGNYFKFPVFLNTDFLFGGIFALLILQFFGVGRGVLAAAVIASYTYFLWNHPYAIVIMTLEVAVVGVLMGRRKIGMIQADALYWLLVGMPLVYLCYHAVMQVPRESTFLIMIKQPLNGLANALVARLIFTGHAIRSRSSLVALRETICNLLAFCVLCPALVLLSLASRQDFADTDQRARALLGQDLRQVTGVLDTWISERRNVVLNLAELSATRSPRQMQGYLEQAKKSDANFRGLGRLDRNAVVTAFYPLCDELGQPSLGRNYADRPFIPELKRNLKPMLSEVVMGRMGAPRPMVAMLAPVLSGGRYAGYVTGVLSLQQLQQRLDQISHQEATLYTLLDKNGNVIMSNRAGQGVMVPFARGQGTLQRLDAAISQWVPAVPRNTPLFERWKKSYYVAEYSAGGVAHWRIVLEQPVAPYQKMLSAIYLRKLGLLFLALMLSLGLAEVMSRRGMASIEELHRITRDLPSRLASGSTIIWPESSMKESHDLINDFREMSASIQRNVSELKSLNDSLESRVEERTQQLRLSINASNIGLWDWDPVSGAASFSPEWRVQLGYGPDEIPDSMQEWESRVHPDDLAPALASLRRHLADATGKYAMEFRLRHKDGSYRWMGAQAQIFRDAAGKAVRVMGCHIDITERKLQETALREQQQFIRSTIDGLGANICVINAEGRIVVTNRAWNSFARENNARENSCHEGSNYFQACLAGSAEEPGEGREMLAGIKAVMDGQLPEFAQEYPCHGPEVKRWFLCKVNSFQVAGKNYAVISHEDVSERKRSAEATEEFYRKLEALSITDGMTGISNRRHFDEVLAQEHARHARTGAELSFILLDVDHFKLFNDCYGHLAGDECLRQIARVIADCAARPADLAARYGGEEFACILPETDLSGAVVIAEEIRRGILALAIPHRGGSATGCVSVSLGVASLQCSAGGSPLALIAQADGHLYRAKSLGRNRVEFDLLAPSGQGQGKLLHLVWKDAFCCGNQLIDLQHQAMFLSCNELLDASLATRPASDIGTLIGRLLDEVSQHFHDEELILEERGFPGRVPHAMEHDRLLSTGRELVQGLVAEGSPRGHGEVFRFLVYEVVLLHMLGADREFSACLRDAGTA